MDKADLENAVREYVQKSSSNYVSKETALRPELAGLKIFDDPVFGYADADDPLFAEIKKPGVIGGHYMTPMEWMPGAKSVIGIFLPFTGQVREANRKNMDWPADEWLHARIEGQAFQNEICRFITAFMEEEGYAALTPMTDPRMSSKSPLTENREDPDFYTSNWSERHAAYIAGLGTFGLSKGLLTAKGTAGRFISIISKVPFKADKRPYSGIYDYCIRCGACARNCPAKAISLEKGKNHSLCSAFVLGTKAKHEPRYGCGKCQVAVPCEFKAPNIKVSL